MRANLCMACVRASYELIRMREMHVFHECIHMKSIYKCRLQKKVFSLLDKECDLKSGHQQKTPSFKTQTCFDKPTLLIEFQELKSKISWK